MKTCHLKTFYHFRFSTLPISADLNFKPDLLIRPDLACFLQSHDQAADLQNVPGPQVVLQQIDFLPGFLLELRPELLEGLELVDELIDDLPEPLVRQVQGHRLLGAQNEVEQVAVVVVGFEPESR